MCARMGGARSHTLNRALGVETEVRLDYATQPVALHDRLLLCSDGVHGFLTDQSIADILRERSAPEDTAGALVAAALQSGSNDNCTALVLDVVSLPTAGSADVSAAILQLPVIPVPIVGETIDGFVLSALISDGRYTRLFGAEDEVEGGTVALKFPKPQIASVDAYRAAFVREAWVALGAQSLGRARHRTAAGTPDLPVHGHAALSRRASGNAAFAQSCARIGRRPQHRRQAGPRAGGAAPRRHHPS